MGQKACCPKEEEVIPTPVPKKLVSSKRSRTCRMGPIVMANYKFQGRSAGELSFEKSDRLEIISKADVDWWFARHMTLDTKGYIPKNYVEPSGPDSYNWYFGNIAKKSATKLLKTNGHEQGTFIIYQSESPRPGYTLSILDKELNVKHYWIRVSNSGYYYISLPKTFRNLSDLVQAYKKKKYGLPCLLQRPCSWPEKMPFIVRMKHGIEDPWEIDRSCLNMIKNIGQGSISEVWYGMWNKSIEVAIKTFKQGAKSHLPLLEAMQNVRHDNILILFGVCTKDDGPTLMVTEYLHNGALLDFLRSQREPTLELDDLLYMSTQVAAGMAYLEKKDLLHRELCASNVLVGEEMICKVADFGLIRENKSDDGLSDTSEVYKVKWCAPEVLSGSSFTIKSDVWSFGVLLMEVITYGANPYPGKTDQEVMELVPSGYRMDKPQNNPCPDQLYQIMCECWHADPLRRPTFNNLENELDNFEILSSAPSKASLDK